MQVLHEQRLILEASRETVWDHLTSLESRKLWQPDIQSARLLYGNPGVKGTKVELTFKDRDTKVIEHIKRSQHLVRIQMDYRLGERRYRQIYSISRISEERTSLMYFCQQDVPSGWLKIFSKPAPPPSFLAIKDLKTLEELLRIEAKVSYS